MGKNNGGHKGGPRKTTFSRQKRFLLNSSRAVKLFARLTELSWSDVRDTCASSRHFLLVQKAQNITEYRDTAPLKHKRKLPKRTPEKAVDLTVEALLEAHDPDDQPLSKL